MTFVLVVMSLIAAWLVAFLGPLSALKEGHAQAQLYATFRNELASQQTPPAPFAPNSTLHEGDPVAVMDAPAIGMHGLVVVEGTTSGDLESGPGHLPGTVLPGEQGVSTILGRAFGFGGPFGGLARLQPHDTLTVTTGQGTFTFSVVDVRGPGQPIPGSLATAASRLTLVTAANSGWKNLWVPSHAIYVDAVLAKGKAAPAVSGTTTPLAADNVMAHDTSGLTVLVLWLQLLLVVALAVTWAAERWGRRQAWVTGVPILIAVLWGTSLQFSQLLPNLL